MGQRVGMRQDLVDVADIAPTRGVRFVARQATAWWPAAQWRDAVNAACRKRMIAPRFPAREAPGLSRQIVQHAGERGQPPGKTRRVDRIVGQGRLADRDGKALGDAGHANARHAGGGRPPAAAAPPRQRIEQREA
ncbi:hypothetical protein ACG873_08105 [Mesorhizobium sp. AaZ16]|uniref:hypothetical protein n=1 Tax=Mesorhizobium sp. AaZ16 TaxID=3402289 RepID=UPI00374E3D12